MLAALSFASGLPYFFFNETVPVWLAASGMSLAGIGLASGASLPWVLKFLWAPLVDRLGSRLVWIRVCLGLLAATTAWLAGADPDRHAGQLAALLLFYVTLSATQDIAIDAYTIETTHGRELGVANSVRIGAYRGASFISSALLVWVAARAGWRAAFISGAVVLGALTLVTLVLPSPRRETAHPSTLAEPIRALLRRPGILAVVMFALLSAVFALSRWAAGLVSGILAQRLGFAAYFFLTFLMGLPAYTLLPRIRNASIGE